MTYHNKQHCFVLKNDHNMMLSNVTKFHHDVMSIEHGDI